MYGGSCQEGWEERKEGEFETSLEGCTYLLSQQPYSNSRAFEKLCITSSINVVCVDSLL